MKRSTKIRIRHQGASVLFYPAALPLSRQTLTYTAGIIRRHRAQISSPWRKLTCSQQALLALAYLRKEAPYTDTPRPDLILLDLNLPRLDGREVLQEIKDDPDLRHIPVIVLTTSQAEEDVLRSYQLHANAYVTKPVDFEGFIEAIKQIDHFFVSVVQLPTGRPG